MIGDGIDTGEVGVAVGAAVGAGLGAGLGAEVDVAEEAG